MTFPFHKIKFNFTAICILSHFSCQTKHLLFYYRTEQLISWGIFDENKLYASIKPTQCPFCDNFNTSIHFAFLSFEGCLTWEGIHNTIHQQGCITVRHIDMLALFIDPYSRLLLEVTLTEVSHYLKRKNYFTGFGKNIWQSGAICNNIWKPSYSNMHNLLNLIKIFEN